MVKSILTVFIILSFSSTLFAQIAAKLATTKADVQNFLGTTNAKLVFENDGFIYFVDYNDATPTIKKLNNSTGGVLPSLSPDGNYVVYATGVSSDGKNGAGKVYVIELKETASPILISDPGFEPRFVQNPSSAYEIIYTTQGGSNLYNGIGKTVKKTFNGTAPGTEQTVFDGGGYVGGISWDNRYLATGFEEGRMMDLQDPQKKSVRIHQLTFKNKITLKDTIGLPQVCNSSITSSRKHTNVMMYIDFKFNSKYFHETINNGVLWKLHEIIFVSDYNNNLIKWIPPPNVPANDAQGGLDFVQWDDPEWSNHPYFSTAGLFVDRSWDTLGSWQHPVKRERIYAINLKEMKLLKLVTTTDTSFASKINMQWPWLWIEIPTNFTEEAGWLDPPSNLEWPFKNKQQDNRYNIRFELDQLIADIPISRVAIYNTAGTMVKEIIPEQITSSIQLPNLETFGEGMYYFRVEAENSAVILSRVIVR